MNRITITYIVNPRLIAARKTHLTHARNLCCMISESKVRENTTRNENTRKHYYYGASFWEGQPLRVSIPKVSSFSLRVKTIAVLKRTRVRITCGYLRVWQFGSLRPQNHVSPSTCHSFMSLSEAHIICLFPETIKSVCLKPWVYPRTQPFRLRLRTKAQKVGPWGLGHIKLEGWVISGSTPLQTLRAMLRQREPSTSSKSASKTWSPVGFAHRLSRTWQRLRLRPWRKRCTAR